MVDTWNFNKNVSWLPKVKERLSEIDNQEDVSINVENVKTTTRKMSNWKAPGSDCIQGCWFKKFSSLHSMLTEHLQTCAVVGDVPIWMTNGKITLIQKDPEKANAANNYCHIACLPLMWKLLISALAEKLFEHLSEKTRWAEERQERLTRNEGTTLDWQADSEALKETPA